MKIKKYHILFITLLSVCALNVSAKSEPFETGWKPTQIDTYEGTKIVVHLNQIPQENQIKAMQRSFQHMKEADQKVEIRILIHGPGLDLLKTKLLSPDQKEFIDQSRKLGIRFQACHNTMLTQKIKVQDLYQVANQDIVPAAILETAKLQKLGFAYIRFF